MDDGASSCDLGSLKVTRTSNAVNSVIHGDVLKNSRVQISVARFLALMINYDGFEQQNQLSRSQNVDKKLRVIASSLRRLTRKMIGPDSIVKHAEKLHLLVYHPTVVSLLAEPSYYYVYE